MTTQSNSPASSPAPSADGSNGPATPVSPSAVQTLALPPPVDTASSVTGANGAAANPAAAKRKPSRRANTAERRATHNAVERARRETLNSRFLDLAALLPNLSQIRRPSKSSIVNSSIAHVHASRRHRLLAARELRQLKLETDALRRELNEWRNRSGLPRVEEPVRGEGFQMILSGEVEILSAGLIEEEDGDEYGNDGYGDDDFASAPALAPAKSEGPFAHNVPHGHPSLQLQTILPRPTSNSSPMIVQSPNAVSLENPAMGSMYDPPHMQGLYMNGGVMPRHEPEGKWAMYGQQQFTPPHSSHGMAQSYNMMGQVQRQAMYHGQGGHMYGSPIDNDDASSVGSHGHSPVPGVKRQRSGSMGSNGSNGGYEMSGVMAGGAGMARRMGNGAWDEGMPMNGGMNGMGHMGGMSGMGMGGRGAQAGMSVGGGGNVYAAMML